MHVPCIEQKVRKTILQSFVVLCLVLLKILPANAQKFIFQEGVEDINFPVLSADPTTGWLKYWQETNSMFVSQPYSTLMRTDSVSRSGKYSARFQLDRAEYPDNIKRINGGSELIWNDACKNPDYDLAWMALSVYLPEWCYGIPEGAPESVVFNVHDYPLPCGTSSRWTNPMNIWVRNNRWILTITADKNDVQANSGATLVTKEYDMGPIETDKWTDWAINRNWTIADDGFVKVYKNGKLLVDHRGPNWYGGNFAKLPYIKMGIYKWPWLNSWNEAWGSRISRKRAIYIDDIKMGTSEATLQDFLYTDQVAPTPNSLPSVNAGSDQTIQLPKNYVTLTGTAKDNDGSISSYAWSLVTGPSGSIIATPTNASTSITGLVNGSYTYRLTVTDNQGGKASDDVKITVLNATVVNLPPVSNAGSDQTINDIAAPAYLDGTASSDPDGSIANYLWIQIAGPSNAVISNTSQAKSPVSFPLKGNYSFALSIRDNNGAADSDTVSILVDPINAVAANINPLANAGQNQVIALPVNRTVLDGSASVDPDGTINTYNWQQVNGPINAKIEKPTSSITNITGLTSGKYAFRLTVTDNRGGSASANVTVEVKAEAIANKKPQIMMPSSFKADISMINDITLDGSASYDPDGTIVRYKWDLLEGPTQALVHESSAKETKVSGLQAGNYSFRLTVTDNLGATADKNIVVNAVSSMTDNQLKLFPNPNNGNFQFKLQTPATGKCELLVYAVSGVLLYKEVFTKETALISRPVDIRSLQSGTYFLSVRINDQPSPIAGKIRKL